MGVTTLVDGPQPWQHHWVYWSHAPSLLGLLILPAMLAALALIVSAGRAVAAHGQRWRTARDHPRPSDEVPAVPVLASDGDREKVVGAVTQAVGEARLSLEEGTDRIDKIWNSRYRHELAALIGDLPRAPSPTPRRRARLGILVAIAAAVAAAALQWGLGLWELWPVAVAVSLVIGVRR
jgi:hypothetical protein